MVCPNCKKEHLPNTRFCSGCGYPLSGASAGIVAPIPPKRKKKNRGLWILLVAVIVLGALLIGGLLIYKANQRANKASQAEVNVTRTEDTATPFPTATPTPAETPPPTPSPTPGISDKVQAKTVTDNYLRELCSFNFKQASLYTTDPTVLMKNAPYDSPDDAVSKMTQNMPAEFRKYDKEVNDYVTAFFHAMKRRTKYRILDVQPKENGFMVIAEVTTVDPGSANISKIMADMMSSADVDTMAEELFLNGTLNEQMTAEEMTDIMIPAMIQKMIRSIDDLNFQTVTVTREFIVMKVGNDWLLDSSKIG